jgi:hypothetical protein
VIYVETGDGPSDANAGNYANSFVAVSARDMKLVDYYTFAYMVGDAPETWGQEAIVFHNPHAQANKRGLAQTQCRPRTSRSVPTHRD